MKTKLTLLMLFVSLTVMAQNGINYKALIKDTNGNVLASAPVSIQFIIYEGAALTNNVYEESHTINTDVNGFVITNIGEGTTGDVFTTIDWAGNDHFLNVQVNTGSGLVDMGTTQFKTVPYAKVAENVSGLEAIDEGNGIGWRLKGRDPNHYGNIGLSAVDLSDNSSNSSNGATAFASTAMGRFTEASGSISTAMGNNTEASGSGSTAMGSNTEASGIISTTMGLQTTAEGDFSTAMGLGTNADAYASTVIGRYNDGGGNATTWNISDAIFEIGRGTSNNDRINALTVFKTGRMRLNSFTDGLEIINGSGRGVNVSGGGSVGFYVNNANVYGGQFRGDEAGVYTRSSNSQNPDIILGGDSTANAEDDGIIASDPTYSGSDIYLRSNDAVVVELDNDDSGNGSFIIQDSDGNNVFSVNEDGTIRQNGSTIHASDKRLKEDIENLDYGLKEVLQLQPKQYFWKGKEQDKKSLGLIAQDVQPIINEIVNIQDDEIQTLGISYTELIPILINAIKEQQKLIESQEKVLHTSTVNYETLLSRIEILESKSSN